MILCEIGDFRSLLRFILACHSMYDLFQSDKSRILSSVLRNSLPEAALRDALAVEVLFNLDPSQDWFLVQGLSSADTFTQMTPASTIWLV
jgi:hypothetical protein